MYNRGRWPARRGRCGRRGGRVANPRRRLDRSDACDRGIRRLRIFFVPLVAVFDAGLYAIVRSRKQPGRTGVLAWALYGAGLHHPAMLACGIVVRLAAALAPRFHLVLLAVVGGTLALWFCGMNGVGIVVEGRRDAVNVASVLVAAAAGVVEWLAFWRRYRQRVTAACDPVALAAAAK